MSNPSQSFLPTDKQVLNPDGTMTAQWWQFFSTLQANVTTWTDYTSTSTITGWASFTANRKGIFYKESGSLVFVYFHLEGPSNATSVSFTLPIAATSTPQGSFGFGNLMLFVEDNSVAGGPGICSIGNAGGSTVTCYPTLSSASTWTAAGTKAVNGQFWYET